LDEQKENDDVFQADGFKIAADKEISFLFDDSHINSSKGLFGDFYTITRKEDENSGCS
jgi:Fe-S cluster assembly iron-binding protein IscA